ncbi:MAG: RNase adapter RapZ [Gammaproteobacteria bacterium]|nr:RNase adapter RapZ [Gammaproteobacteria bacterium]HXK55780.1 RNase adapter RapZ [Gammaproteobacteria bacterium]
MKLAIVTGLSGSGKSVALKTLEDLGYYCIDNLPLFLLPRLTREMATKNDPLFELVAIGIDSRSHSTDLGSTLTLLSTLNKKGIQRQLIYLEAQNSTLIKRYSESRRRHPLSDERHPLMEAIQLERKLLSPFFDSADLCIDTTRTNMYQLRDIIRSHVIVGSAPTLSLLFESFGFKHGIPNDADFVYDARCLPNPHWQSGLRSLTGKDQEVADFLEQDGNVLNFKNDIIQFLDKWIPCFQADGRSYLTIAIGCTGGQHRSVYLTEKISNHFRTSKLPVITRHRELT